MLPVAPRPQNTQQTIGYFQLSDTCDCFSTTIESFQRRLNKLASQTEAVTKAIDEATSYSYKNNPKIFGVPQRKEKETAEETTSLCLKIFKKIGVDISETDIDIAHRIPTRNQNGGEDSETTQLLASL